MQSVGAKCRALPCVAVRRSVLQPTNRCHTAHISHMIRTSKHMREHTRMYPHTYLHTHAWTHTFSLSPHPPHQSSPSNRHNCSRFDHTKDMNYKRVLNNKTSKRNFSWHQKEILAAALGKLGEAALPYFLYVCEWVCMCVCVSVDVYICIHTYICIYTYICIHKYIYIYTYTYIYV